MNRERLRKIRNYQSKDWYPAIFMRPLCILVMLVVADWPWLTPNLATTLATITKLAAAAMVLTGDRTWIIVGVVVFLQLGLLLDHLDGTLARYRRTFTAFGGFYDKVSDVVAWFVVMMALGWVDYRASGDPVRIVLAAVGAYGLLMLGYAKWVTEHATEQARWMEAAADPAAAVAARLAPIEIASPPERTPAQWLRWFLWASTRFYRCEEMDLYFWAALAVLLDRIEWFLWMAAITQGVGALVLIVVRARTVTAIDRRRRRFATRDREAG